MAKDNLGSAISKLQANIARIHSSNRRDSLIRLVKLTVGEIETLLKSAKQATP